MIRDTRKINIETNFFQDDGFYSSKPQQDTLQGTLMVKDKAAIFFYNILDTFRLQRIIHAFGLFVNNVNPHIRKYSSKQILVNNKNYSSKPQSSTNRIYKNSIIRNQELDDQLRVFKYNDLQRNQRKALSLNAKNVKNSSYLRESRKRILQSINQTLNNEPISQNKAEFQKKAKIVNNKIEPQLQKNQNSSLENKTQQNIQIRNRLQKIEKLMKNIRRQKDKKQTVIVHKQLVAQLPKRQKNNKQMFNFMEELKSLRTQIHQIKQINQQILHHSRQRSIKSSKIGTKSQKQVNINTLSYRDIKRSQFLENHYHKQNSKQSSPKYRRHERYEKDSKRLNMKKSVTSQKSYPGQKRQLSINNQTSLSILPERKNNVDVKKPAQQFRKNTNLIQNIQVNLQQKSNKQIYERPKQLVISHGRLKPQNSLQHQIYNKQLSFQQASPYFEMNDKSLKRQQQSLDINFIKSQIQSYNNYEYKNNYDIASKYQTTNQSTLPADTNNQIAKKDYKSSTWYNQYGSPKFNPIKNINMQLKLNENNQIKISKDVVSFSIQNDEIPKQVSKVNKIQGFGIDRLNQLTDKISYSNFNSARTSNYSRQEEILQQADKYQNYNKYNQRNPVYIPKQLPIYNNKQPNYRQSNSDYTNPALLKTLNINTYPKTNPNIPWYDSSNNNTNYYKTKYNYQYQSSYNTHPNTQSSYHMHLIDTKNKQKIASQKSIQDNHSYNSYTYSNNSSNTSMAKLEQEYQDIINSPAQQYPKYQIHPTFNKYQGNNQAYQHDKYSNYNKHISNNHKQSSQHNNYQQDTAYDGSIANTQNIGNSSYGHYNSYSYQQIYEDYIRNK